MPTLLPLFVHSIRFSIIIELSGFQIQMENSETNDEKESEADENNNNDKENKNDDNDEALKDDGEIYDINVNSPNKMKSR